MLGRIIVKNIRVRVQFEGKLPDTEDPNGQMGLLAQEVIYQIVLAL